MPKIPHEVTIAADPHAAFVAYQCDVQKRHNATWQEVEDALPMSLLSEALTRRRKMEELWPEVPAGCYVYACWNRPASEYYTRLPEGAVQLDQRADWLNDIAWTYIATPELLSATHWPDVQLLRLPLS